MRQVFPLSPNGIIDHLKLRKPQYLKTAAYGHFGQAGFAWEKANATDELLAKTSKVVTRPVRRNQLKPVTRDVR